MNCVNGHSVMDSMKFCPVCGVLVSAGEQEYKSQPEQSEFAAVYTPPKLSELNIKTPKKLVIAALAFVAFAAFASAGGNDEESSTSSSPKAETNSTTQEFDVDIIQTGYIPLNLEMASKFKELADYANAGDVQSLVSACFDLADLAERGQALPPTGDPLLDQLWNDAMESGISASYWCVLEDFDTATTYIVQMGEQTEALISYLE